MKLDRREFLRRVPGLAALPALIPAVGESAVASAPASFEWLLPDELASRGLKSLDDEVYTQIVRTPMGFTSGPSRIYSVDRWR